MRKVHAHLGIKSTSVGYCHVDTGCKIAADELVTSNGIVRVRVLLVLLVSFGLV